MSLALCHSERGLNIFRHVSEGGAPSRVVQSPPRAGISTDIADRLTLSGQRTEASGTRAKTHLVNRRHVGAVLQQRLHHRMPPGLRGFVQTCLHVLETRRVVSTVPHSTRGLDMLGCPARCTLHDKNTLHNTHPVRSASAPSKQAALLFVQDPGALTRDHCIVHHTRRDIALKRNSPRPPQKYWHRTSRGHAPRRDAQIDWPSGGLSCHWHCDSQLGPCS